jgi:hypothetical protein
MSEIQGRFYTRIGCKIETVPDLSSLDYSPPQYKYKARCIYTTVAGANAVRGAKNFDP